MYCIRVQKKIEIVIIDRYLEIDVKLTILALDILISMYKKSTDHKYNGIICFFVKKNIYMIRQRFHHILRSFL